MCVQNVKNPHEQRVPSASTMVHAKYDGDNLHFDIAILRLSKPLKFNDYLQPVCIPTTPAAAGTNCIALGWGKTKSTSINAQLNTHCEVQQHCCNDDQQSQWENGNFDPPVDLKPLKILKLQLE